MWQDMGLYWAWRGDKECKERPPTKKQLEYAKLQYLNLPEISICCGVFDDGRYTEKNRAEIEWHVNMGAVLTWPLKRAEILGEARSELTAKLQSAGVL